MRPHLKSNLIETKMKAIYIITLLTIFSQYSYSQHRLSDDKIWRLIRKINANQLETRNFTLKPDTIKHLFI